MNGDPVLFAAYTKAGSPLYSFACPRCGRHQADQPDTMCPGCDQPAKPARRRTRTPAKR